MTGIETFLEIWMFGNEEYGAKEKELNSSIWARSITRCRAAIEAGADGNAKEYPSSRPAICVAVARNFAEAVPLLIAAGADVNAKGDKGLTVLHEAVYRGDLALCKLLLESGANPNAESDNGTVPLTVTGATKRLDVCDLLMEAGADPAYRPFAYSEKAGFTPFQRAVKNGDIEAVRWYVLKHGQSLQQKNSKGKSLSVIAGSKDMKAELRSLKAEVVVREAIEAVDQRHVVSPSRKPFAPL